MKNFAALISSSALALSLSAQTFAAGPQQKVDFDQSTGTTAFHAVGHPSAIKINGTGAAPKGKLTWTGDGKLKGALTLDLKSLDTGIETRTTHMKEKYLEVGKYPQAKLDLTEVSLAKGDFAKDFVEDAVAFKGNLTLHGVTKLVSGTAHIERHGDSSSLHAEFPVKISEYSIAVPAFAGITVADEVTLAIDAKAPVVKM